MHDPRDRAESNERIYIDYNYQPTQHRKEHITTAGAADMVWPIMLDCW